MSNDEVKRWTLENHGGELFSSPIIDTYEEVVSSADHERIVAEKDAEIARLIQEVANRNQYKLNQEALDNVHKVYEEQLAEARQLISSLLSGVEFYSSSKLSRSSDSEYGTGILLTMLWNKVKGFLKKLGKIV